MTLLDHRPIAPAPQRRLPPPHFPPHFPPHLRPQLPPPARPPDHGHDAPALRMLLPDGRGGALPWPVAPPPDIFAMPPPAPRNSRAVNDFNRGHIDYRSLMRLTTASMTAAGSCDEVLACLRAVKTARHPSTGRQAAPDTICFFAALASCARHGYHREAIDLFNEMLTLGLDPKPDPYRWAIEACGRAGEFAEALGLFLHMCAYGPHRGIEADPTTHAIAVSWCGRHMEAVLIESGIHARVFHPGLGLDADRNRVDLRRNAVYAQHYRRQPNHDLHPRFVGALMRHLLRQGRLNQNTRIVCNMPVCRATGEAIESALAEHFAASDPGPPWAIALPSAQPPIGTPEAAGMPARAS